MTKLSLYIVIQVNKGEEIYILFEINDWAFVTLLKDSSRRGYIPVDYCDVIQDFFSFNPAVCTWYVNAKAKPSLRFMFFTLNPDVRQQLYGPDSDENSRKVPYIKDCSAVTVGTERFIRLIFL